MNKPLHKAILPGALVNGQPATLGVMGGGQLGRMFVHAAQSMGYRTAVLDADPVSPAGLVSHFHIQTGYEDAAGLAELAERFLKFVFARVLERCPEDMAFFAEFIATSWTYAITNQVPSQQWQKGDVPVWRDDLPIVTGVDDPARVGAAHVAFIGAVPRRFFVFRRPATSKSIRPVPKSTCAHVSRSIASARRAVW